MQFTVCRAAVIAEQNYHLDTQPVLPAESVLRPARFHAITYAKNKDYACGVENHAIHYPTLIALGIANKNWNEHDFVDRNVYDLACAPVEHHLIAKIHFTAHAMLFKDARWHLQDATAVSLEVGTDTS